MEDPAAELAAYFQTRTRYPIKSSSGSAGRRGLVDTVGRGLAAACQVRRRSDTQGIVTGPGGTTPHTGAGLLYQATHSNDTDLITLGMLET